jgi:predicted component of type VI protein secretion system
MFIKANMRKLLLAILFLGMLSGCGTWQKIPEPLRANGFKTLILNIDANELREPAIQEAVFAAIDKAYAEHDEPGDILKAALINMSEIGLTPGFMEVVKGKVEEKYGIEIYSEDG